MERKLRKNQKTKAIKLVLVLGLIVLGIVAGKYIIQAIDPPSWTDSTITAGQTPIRKVHIDELRSEINTNETDVGLSATSFTDSTIVASETVIKAIHFTEIRSAIEGIFTKIEDSLPSWTNATLTPGETVIRKTHLDELRTETTNAYNSINAKKCCGNYGGSDTGSAGSCPGTDDSECGTIDCSGWYIQTGTEGVNDTEYCYNKQDMTSSRCEALDDCKDANTSDCDSQSNDAEQYNCAACKYISASDCTGTTLGSCTNYADNTDCTGTCKSCSSGSCENTADGQDYQSECDGLDCSGYYVQTGTQGAETTEECYDRADEPAGTHNCKGDGTCRDAGDDCPSNSADTYKYECALCKYIHDTNACYQTTLGSCTTYANGTSCGTDKYCENSICCTQTYGSDVCTGGTPSASHSTEDWDWHMPEAFNNVWSTVDDGWYYNGCAGGLPYWLKYDLGSGNAKVVIKYRIQSYWGSNYNPIDWTFQGSNNDSNWDTLDTRSGISWTSSNQIKDFTFSNITAYRYYRIYITQTSLVGGTRQVIIREMEMIEGVLQCP